MSGEDANMNAAAALRSLLQEGAAALARQDFKAAKQSFSHCAETDAKSAAAWFGLALATAHLGEDDAAIAAVTKMLAIDPGNFRALILRGDLYLKQGDKRAAAAFYSVAVKRAPPAATLTPALRDELAGAQAKAQALAEEFNRYVEERLGGVAAATQSPRFTRSLDLLMGRRQIYYQQPIFYYFPELPQIQFYERAQFPWAEALEAATPHIRAELESVMARGDAFAPYVQGEKDRPNSGGRALVNNPDWGACFLMKNGERVAAVADACPQTMKALENVPLAAVPGRSPSVLFSLLQPGMRIPPHFGFVNTRLIGHLPLIVPEQCGLRVGNETRAWKEGELLLFDDSIEHEAWNLSDKPRVVLLFDFWRPELTMEERALVTTMFQAIDAYGVRGPDWT